MSAYSPLTALRLLILLSLGACGDKDTNTETPEASVPFAVPSSATPSGSAVCEGAEPITGRSNLYTGFYRCPDGTAHRIDPAAVDPNWDHQSCQGTEEDRDCLSDSDCTDGTYGRCVTSTSEPDGQSLCGCRYSCSIDDDCNVGRACVAPEVGTTGSDYPVCVEAICEDGESCASGECGFSTTFDGCGHTLRQGCRSDADDCRVDTDCEGDTGPWSKSELSCGIEYDGSTWTCNGLDCTPGRPLLIDGQPRTAPTTPRADWTTQQEVPVALDGLSPLVRAALAHRWAKIGALEHASVASFARFTLQLLVLGAPSELLADAQRAAADEVEHARLAYSIASAYAGVPVGPGPLSMAGHTPPLSDRSAALCALIEEGCIGETLGAAEARASTAQATDPAVRAVLHRIADDEERHAALAWRTLKWMLQETPTLRPLAASHLRSVVVDWQQREPGEERPALAAHGVLSGLALRQLQRAALFAVVEPSLRAVLQASHKAPVAPDLEPCGGAGHVIAEGLPDRGERFL
ncbi:MAG: hypothetical protein ACI8S6_004817 [Myxococcota bacterium]|jgi:hypothetical protein